MKTVVENNTGLDRNYTLSVETDYPVLEGFEQGRSCFYDFGAKSSVEFSGFVNEGDSPFVDEIGKWFQEYNRG